MKTFKEFLSENSEIDAARKKMILQFLPGVFEYKDTKNGVNLLVKGKVVGTLDNKVLKDPDLAQKEIDAILDSLPKKPKPPKGKAKDLGPIDWSKHHDI